MQDVAGHGRTILFVSHNMASVTRLCTRAIWVENGTVRLNGKTEDVVSAYLTAGACTEGERIWKNGVALSGITEFELISASVKTEDDNVNNSLDVRKPFWVEICYSIKERLPFCRVGFNVATSDGVIVFVAYDADKEEFAKRREPGSYMSRCEIPGNLLSPGRYTVSIAAGITGVKTLVNEESVIGFDVIDTGSIGSNITNIRKGIIRPRLKWLQESK